MDIRKKMWKPESYKNSAHFLHENPNTHKNNFIGCILSRKDICYELYDKSKRAFPINF